MDGFIEGVCIGEGLVGKVMGFEVAPDPFDVIELGYVFLEAKLRKGYDAV